MPCAICACHACRSRQVHLHRPALQHRQPRLHLQRPLRRQGRRYRHSKWLEFMYRRLELAKELLTEDGVIFVSIDDNEVFTLGYSWNRYSGRRTSLATCIWQKALLARKNRGAIFGDAHEYLLAIRLILHDSRNNEDVSRLGEKQRTLFKNPGQGPAWILVISIDLSAITPEKGTEPTRCTKLSAPSGIPHPPPDATGH